MEYGMFIYRSVRRERKKGKKEGGNLLCDGYFHWVVFT